MPAAKTNVKASRRKQPDDGVGSPVEGSRILTVARIERGAQVEGQPQIEDGVETKPRHRLNAPVVIAREILAVRPPERVRGDEHQRQHQGGKEACQSCRRSEKERSEGAADGCRKGGIEVSKPQVNRNAHNRRGQKTDEHWNVAAAIV